jgi:hypothetical protein
VIKKACSENLQFPVVFHPEHGKVIEKAVQAKQVVQAAVPNWFVFVSTRFFQQ